jgi:YidC/Oxa1 family membrane protein insertase
MKYILILLSLILGYLMNVFYVLLDLIATPYIWICIILFSLVTRFIFLPEKIRNARKKKLSKVIDSEVSAVQCKYLNFEKTKEEKRAEKREIKAVYKKYRVSSGSGCLVALLQLPIYIALYNVVISPEIFVPAVKRLYADTVANADLISTVNNFFGLDIGFTPIKLGLIAYIFPLLVCIFTIFKTRKSLLGPKIDGPKKKFFYWYIRAIFLLQVVLFTCLSFKFPLGMSIYWISNDIVNFIIDYFITKSINNNQKINGILEAYKERLVSPAAEAVANENSVSYETVPATANAPEAEASAADIDIETTDNS